jgi:hypothetical protein
VAVPQARRDETSHRGDPSRVTIGNDLVLAPRADGEAQGGKRSDRRVGQGSSTSETASGTPRVDAHLASPPGMATSKAASWA